MSVTRRGFSSMAVAVAALLATSARARAQTALKVTLDGRIDGPSAPFFVALEAGHFKAAGLEVSIEPSAGGAEPISRLASGAFDLGLADINTFIRYRDQNPGTPIKAVFILNNRPSYAVIGRKSRGVSSPQDLVGMRLGAPAAEAATAAWPIFARLNDIDPAKVRVTNVGALVREPMLAAGEVDAVTGSASGTPVTLRERGVPADDITTFLMGSYGLELYGSAILASGKALAEKPDAVKGFLAALVRGIQDTLREPVAAIGAVARRMNGGNRDIEFERLRIVIETSILTAETMTHGLGGIQVPRFETAIEQLASSYSFKAKPKPADIFEPSLLPPEEARRVG